MNIQMDSLEAIKKLGELKEIGLVSEEEFQEKKALIRLKEKQEMSTATHNIGNINQKQNEKADVERKDETTISTETRSRHKLRKRKEVENKVPITKPRASSNSHKHKKRRKIETLEGTTAPASNPSKCNKKNGFSSALFVGMGIVVVAIFGAVLWRLLK